MSIDTTSESARRAENWVRAQLVRRGWRLLSQRFRRAGTELDLVMTKGSTVAFIEVKYRGRSLPFENARLILSSAQKRALIRGVRAFASERNLKTSSLRVDLAVVQKARGRGQDLCCQYYVNAIDPYNRAMLTRMNSVVVVQLP